MEFQRARSDSIESVSGTKRPGRFSAEGVGLWTDSEHERFMMAIAMYPRGPWRLVADFVGTRNARQTMTHAQKYKQKLARRLRGLRTPGRVPGRRRKESLTESELECGSESNDQEPTTERPYLPVVVRTGVPRDPVAEALAEVLGDDLSSLLDVTTDDADEWRAISGGNTDEDMPLDDDLFQLLDMECPASPTSTAGYSSTEGIEDMSLDELLNMAYMT